MVSLEHLLMRLLSIIKTLLKKDHLKKIDLSEHLPTLYLLLRFFFFFGDFGT
jgi:hypothetical protein